MISSFCIAVARCDFYRCESDLYIFPMLVVFHLGCGNIRNVLFSFATKCREFRKMRSALTKLYAVVQRKQEYIDGYN